MTFKASGPIRVRQRCNSCDDIWRQALQSPSWLRGKSYGEISPKLAEAVLLPRTMEEQHVSGRIGCRAVRQQFRDVKIQIFTYLYHKIHEKQIS